MKKNLLVFLFLLFSFSSNALSEEVRGVYAKLAGGINLVDDTDFQGASQTSFVIGTNDYDTGYAASIAAGYRLNNNLAFELEYSTRSNSISGARADGGDILSLGDGDVDALLLNTLVYFDNLGYVLPYVGAGIGFATKFDYEVEVDGFGGAREDDGNAFAFQFILGAEFPISDSLRLFTEGRFFSLSSPNVSNSVGEYNVNYDTLGVVFGLSLLF